MDANQLENTILFFFKEGSKEAHDAILSIFQDSSSITLFLECLQSSQNSNVRFFCLTTIRRMIIRDRDEVLPIEMQQMLFSSITKLIAIEQDDTLRDNMGEFITNLKLDPETPSSIACTEFSFNLIQSKQPPLISTALFIIYHSYNSLPPPQQQEVFQTILPVSIENLMNPEFKYRFNSMKLLTNLLFNALDRADDAEDDSSEASLFNSLSEAILHNANRLNTEPFEPNEPKYIYQLANIAIRKCKFFDKYLPPFTEIFLTFLFNAGIDVMARYNALENISDLFITAIDQIEPFKQKLIEGCIRLTIEIATVAPDVQDVISDLVEWLEESLDSEEVYKTFSTIAMSLISSNDIIQARVAFDILSCIVEGSPDSVNDDIDTIHDLLITYLDPKNNSDQEGNILEFIPISCANVIRSLCETDPNYMMAHVETFIPLLFNYLWIQNCLDAIQDLTSIANLPPEKCEEYLHQTLKLIESTMSDPNSTIKIDPESLIQMLIGFLETINVRDETIYANIMPLVQSLIQSPNFTPSQKMLAANLFGKMIIICPQSASVEINNFIQFSLGLFSSDDSETNLSIVEFLETVLLNQSKYITPYIKDIFESLQKLFEESQKNLDMLRHSEENIGKSENEEEEIDEDEKFVYPKKMLFLLQQSILNLLCTICSIYPSQTSGYFEHIFTVHRVIISSTEDQKLKFGAIDDFEILSNAYIAAGCDTYDLLIYLINELANPNIFSLKDIKELWKMIAVVMANGGSQLIKRCSGDIIIKLSNVLFKEKKVYNEKGNENEISHLFRIPVFTVLDTFIEELGSECHQFIEKFIDVLYRMAENQSIKSSCYAARSLAKIATTLPIEDENGNRFVNKGLQTALRNIKEKDINTQICGLSTLNVILRFRPDLIDPIKGDLFEYTSSIINKNLAGSPDSEPFLNECIILLLSMVRIFKIIGEENIGIIREATNLAILDFDSPDLIPYSLFAQFILQFDQENFMDFYLYLLLLILSSSQMILRKFDPGTLVEFARKITTLSEEEIIARLQFNLTKFDILRNNISTILGGNQES